MDQKLLSGFETGLKQLQKEISAVQENFLIERLNFFRKMLNGMEKNLRKPRDNKEPHQNLVWEEISSFFKQLHNALESDEELAEYLQDEDVQKRWQATLIELVSESEEKVSIPFEAGFWSVRDADNWNTRLRKRIYYLVHPLYYLNARRNQPRPEKLPNRVFYKTSFNRTYLVLPAIEHLTREQDNFLQQYSHILTGLQDMAKLFKDRLIHAEGINNPEKYWVEIEKTDPYAAISDFRRSVDDLEKELSAFSQEIIERSDQFCSGLFSDYLEKYEIAGTILLPVKKFSANYVRNQRHRTESEYEHFRLNWLKHFQAVKDEWQKDLELGNLQVVFATLCQETAYFINQKAETKILPAMKKVHDRLEISSEHFESIRNEQAAGLKNTILQQSHSLLKNLSRKDLPQLVDALIQANFAQTFGGFLARTSAAIEMVAESHVIIKDYNLKEYPPRTTTVEIPMKDLILNEILPDELEASRNLENDVRTKLETITRNISLIDQVVEFNIGAALDLLKEEELTGIKPEADVHQIIQDGMERTTNLLSDIEDNFRKVADDGVARVQVIALDMQKDIQALADNEKIMELKLRLARARTEEKLRHYRQQTWQIVKTFLPKLLALIREAVSRLLSGYVKVRRISGLDSVAERAAEDIMAFRLEQIAKTRQLPFIYQQLFRLKPLEEKRFFYGRKTEMDLLQSDFEDFASGEHISTAIIGEKGNGKTTMLNFARTSIFKGYSLDRIVIDQSVVTEKDLIGLLSNTLNIESAKNFEELKSSLLEGNRKICVVEDIHNLFIRTIDGFIAIERLLALITATKSHIFWIVTSGLYGWEYLEHVIQLSGYFSRKIVLSPLSTNDVREMILARHQMSGFRLQYSVPAKISESRSYKKLSSEDERKAYLEQQFFEELAEEAGGNIKSTILHWLNAIESIDEEEITIAGQFDLDFSFLTQLPSIELYALAAFIQHEYLTTEQFSRIFNISIDDSELLLGRMSRKGYLESNGPDFYIPTMFYRPAVRALKLKNILS